MRVLVTGGAGGLGINVCTLLTQTGHEVRVFDLKTERSQKSIQKIEDSVEVFWGDITRIDSIKQSLEEVDIVVHMAAILPPLALESPEVAKRVNVGGTQNLTKAIKEKSGVIPVIYTSSVSVFGPTPDAEEPLSPERNKPNPVDSYSETKLEAENIIKQSGLDFVILRLTSTPYLSVNFKEMKQMYDIPLDNRVEFSHPGNIALAIDHAVENIDSVRGKTLIISGGSSQRMRYRDMIGGIFNLLGLPLPPEEKFTREPYYLDWYDTSESERLLHFQKYTYADYLKDLANQLSKQYGRFFVPFMQRFIGPVFGKLISRMM